MEDWSNEYEALMRNLVLVSQLYKMDEIPAKSLLNYWGGGYEIIYRNENGDLEYLKDYTIVFWVMDLEKEAAEIEPEGFLKYENRGEFSIIFSYRQGKFNTTVLRDVGHPRRPIVLKRPDKEYFNSHIHMNILCTIRRHMLIRMHYFCSKYKKGESISSVIWFNEGGTASILIPEKFSVEYSKFIRDVEKTRAEGKKIII